MSQIKKMKIENFEMLALQLQIYVPSRKMHVITLSIVRRHFKNFIYFTDEKYNVTKLLSPDLYFAEKVLSLSLSKSKTSFVTWSEAKCHVDVCI